GYVYRGSQVSELRGKYIFGNFGSDGEGQIYAVDVDQLEDRDDFSNLTSLDGGFLAPVQQLQFVDADGDPITLLDLVRDRSGNNSQTRTDMRFGIDNNGEVYISSKKDGWIRRFVGTPLPDCDFDNDGNCNDVDVDNLTGAIVDVKNGAAADLMFDMNGDGTVDNDDLDSWLTAAGTANPGVTSGNPFLGADANLDGVVDISDFNIWNGNKFTGLPEFTGGDFNADGVVDISDFNIWNALKFTSSSSPESVPEPNGAWALLIGAFGLGRVRRRITSCRREWLDARP
ncbi:MAG: PEP-CTERM sorting domain-containing protein, partial [Planctomycetota bacterium]